MFSKEKMIDAATGASPPQARTRDIGCSPIRYGLSLQSTSESGEIYDLTPILLNQEKQKTKEDVVMKKIVVNEQTSSLSLPLSCSSSSNSTPVLSSISRNQPISLMSLEVNDCYGFHTTRESSSTTGNNDRWWPVDRPSRSRSGYKYHQRVRNVHGDHIRHGRGYHERSSQIRSGTCHHDHYHATNSCKRCCNCKHHHP